MWRFLTATVSSWMPIHCRRLNENPGSTVSECGKSQSKWMHKNNRCDLSGSFETLFQTADTQFGQLLCNQRSVFEVSTRRMSTINSHQHQLVQCHYGKRSRSFGQGLPEAEEFYQQRMQADYFQGSYLFGKVLSAVGGR